MTSRERVLLAVNHQEPDRVPIFKPNIIPTYEPFDERVQHFLDTFKFDHFVGFNGFIQSPSRRRELPDDMFEDSYGCKFKYKGVGGPYCIHHPLSGAKTIKDVERFSWPDANGADLLAKEARKKAKEIFENTECATSVSVDMLFHRYQWLRGFNQWLIDMKLNPELHKAIADKIYHINLTLAMRLLNEVGNYTDIVMTGDDFGTSTAPFMSPQDFRAYIKPYYTDLIGRIKGKFPHIKFYLHSHGQIMDLVPDLIDCGVDILNPILPLDNMDTVRLKREFGRQLSFEGGVDIEHILPFGTVDDVRKHVKQVIDILVPGGGFMFKAQAISRIIPSENIITTYNLALEYGRYDR
jgi:uroporphyrinogen decarboxylase